MLAKNGLELNPMIWKQSCVPYVVFIHHVSKLAWKVSKMNGNALDLTACHRVRHDTEDDADARSLSILGACYVSKLID